MLNRPIFFSICITVIFFWFYLFIYLLTCLNVFLPFYPLYAIYRPLIFNEDFYSVPHFNLFSCHALPALPCHR